MAVRKPLVHVSGRTKELPSGDTVPVPWAWLTGTPTTLAGYGITDAANNFGTENIGGIKTLTGTQLVMAPSGASFEQRMDVAATFTADLTWLRAGVRRWQLRMGNSAESGGDAGSTLDIRGYTDAGAAQLLARWFRTGVLDFAFNPEVNDVPLLAEDSTAVVHTTGAETIAGLKTFTSSVTIQPAASAAQVFVRGAVGTVSDVIFGEGVDNRWLFRKQALAANDLQILSYDDAGVSTLRATWNRSTGVLNFNQAPTYAGAAILNATDHPFSGNNVGSTLAQRSAAGDLVARLFRSEFANQTTISGAMAFRINDSGDNYIRFCSDAPAIRTFLGAPALANAETFTGLKTFAPGGGGHPSLSSSFHSLIVGDRGTGDGLANLLLNPLGVDGGIGLRYSSSADTFSLNDWGTGGAPARWTMERLTGNVAMTGGLGMGSAVAGAATTLTRHVALFSTTYGFSVTSQRLNYVSPTGTAHEFYVGAVAAMRLDDQDLILNGKVALRSNDAWLRINPSGGFTNGIYGGTGLLRHDGNFQIGTTSTNGFFASPTVAPKWKDIELGYRKVPLTTQNANYVFVADDAGKGRMKTDTTARSYTINNAVHEAGDVLTAVNHAATANITLVQGAGVTLYLAGTATTGNRTIAPRGYANVFMVTAAIGLVSGPGVT